VNRLAQETSPYLLQHAHNPVDWYPWGDEAFERARAEDKPVLLSVGYSACHWCHVMERESFEDEATARLMNDRFVNIKVDREERPDVDAVYMEAVVALTGQGGWPMTVFLTSEGEPFFGGTYYPPEPRHGMPAFRQVLGALSNAYRDQRDDIAQQAAELVDHLQHSARTQPSEEPLTEDLLDQAIAVLRTQYDPQWGGFGHAPKFPPSSTIEFLLRRGAFEMALGTLDGMRAGGMYDLVGGGFHRYSVDNQWLIPHFEKMLYDNALLVPAYLHAFVLTGEESYKEIVEQTLDYALRELRLDAGGFASAQDADTEGVEGLTFTWEPGEAPREELLQPFEHGRFVIRGRLIADEREMLLAAREKRPQPLRDDKAITSWNGLMLAALAESARRLDRNEYLEAATQLADFLLGELSDDRGRLHRTWRDGVAKGTGYLEDYANVAHGLYELHVASGELRWLHHAHRLALLAIELFADDENGGFFTTPVDGETLVARQKDLDDNPTPSGNAMLAYVLLRLARIWGDDELEQRGAGVLRLVRDLIPRAPQAFGWTLCALDLYLSTPRELAIVGDRLAPVARAALAPLNPNAVVAFGPAEDVPLLAGKGLVDGQTAVYACERFACRAPVTDPALLADT
jgi:uncharacterized protein